MNRNVDYILLFFMILSFFFAGGAFINGLFMIISGGLKNPGNLKIFVIAACFFLSGKILLSVIERRRKMSQGKKIQKKLD